MSKINEALISRIYMEFLKVSKKRKTVPIGESAKAMNRLFPKEKIQEANKHTMRYSKQGNGKLKE